MKSNLLTPGVILFAIAMYLINGPQITWSPAKIVGAVIIGISLPLFALARLQLGKSFSLQAKASSLVTTGLYSRIRNPIYLFGGSLLAGGSLFISPWGPLVVVVLIVPLQVYRARNEERVLASTFGDEYQRYKSKTWF
jgi:protein-S-isoprenylcysteine O-methyltransferase Ste14